MILTAHPKLFEKIDVLDTFVSYPKKSNDKIISEAKRIKVATGRVPVFAMYGYHGYPSSQTLHVGYLISTEVTTPREIDMMIVYPDTPRLYNTYALCYGGDVIDGNVYVHNHNYE